MLRKSRIKTTLTIAISSDAIGSLNNTSSGCGTSLSKPVNNIEIKIKDYFMRRK